MRRKFTLIEILIVIGIIGLLAALSFGAYTFAMNKSRESATKALLKRVEAGLESCKNKFGYYPPAGSYTTITVSLDGSNDVTDIKFGGVSISPEMRKEFLRIVDAESLKKNIKSGELQDNWGTPLYYRYPGVELNKDAIVVISAGADGKWGNGNANTPSNTIIEQSVTGVTNDDLVN